MFGSAFCWRIIKTLTEIHQIACTAYRYICINDDDNNDDHVLICLFDCLHEFVYMPIPLHISAMYMQVYSNTMFLMMGYTAFIALNGINVLVQLESVTQYVNNGDSCKATNDIKNTAHGVLIIQPVQHDTSDTNSSYSK